MTRVVIFDITWVTKYLGACANGEEFIQKQIINAFHPYFVGGCKLVILVFDRFTPVNKSAEHYKRYGHIVPTPLPVNPEGVFAVVGPSAEEIAVRNSRKFVAYGEETARMNNFNNHRNTKYTGSYSVEEIEAEEERKASALERDIRQRFEANDPAAALVMTDFVAPHSKSWDSVMKNHQLKKEIMHYLTCKLVCDPSNPDTYTSGVYKKRQISSKLAIEQPLTAGYTPANGGIFCIHGGQSLKPSRDRELNKSLQSDDFLVTVSAQVDTSNQLGGMSTFRREVSNADHHHPREIVGNIGEGEIGCMYYSMQHRGEDQLIVTGDGDVMFIALLASRYRLADDMQTFKNKVFVLLRIPNRTTKYTQRVTQAKKTDAAESLYVDINKLYNETLFKGDFSHCVDPIATQVAVFSLMKNDFIKGYASGLTGGVEPETQTPWVALPLVKANKQKYKNMIRIVYPSTRLPGSAKPNLEARQSASFFNSGDGNGIQNAYEQFLLGQMLEETMETPEVIIDEDLFVAYTKECYYWKYCSTGKVQNAAKKIIAKEKAQKGELTFNQELVIYLKLIEAHTNTFKKVNDRMMSDRMIRAFARRLKWLLTYWSSSYLGKCAYPNPCETYMGKSYYGWKRSSETYVTCEATDDISPEKPRGTGGFKSRAGFANQEIDLSLEENNSTEFLTSSSSISQMNNVQRKTSGHRDWVDLSCLEELSCSEEENGGDSVEITKQNIHPPTRNIPAYNSQPSVIAPDSSEQFLNLLLGDEWEEKGDGDEPVKVTTVRQPTPSTASTSSSKVSLTKTKSLSSTTERDEEKQNNKRKRVVIDDTTLNDVEEKQTDSLQRRDEPEQSQSQKVPIPKKRKVMAPKPTTLPSATQPKEVIHQPKQKLQRVQSRAARTTTQSAQVSNKHGH
jgi:hypothetical protein